MGENKRGDLRQRVLKSGRIVLEDLHGIECTLRDVSATGAKLMVKKPDDVPDTFRLIISADSTIRPVKVMWRKPDSVGVQFTGDAKKSLLKI
jgi:PilZ domain